MSNVIYVVPWAICDTESMYIKKIDSKDAETPVKGGQVDDDWCIRNVIPNPDKRSKDIYAIVDVYNGYREKLNEKGMSVVSLNNSIDIIRKKGYVRATDEERDYIRKKVLKLKK